MGDFKGEEIFIKYFLDYILLLQKQRLMYPDYRQVESWH